MKNSKSKNKLLAILAFAAIAGVAFTQPAKADGDHWRPEGARYAYDDHEWREHELYAHRWHRLHPEPVPHVVYAPPPVVYQPPPPPPGINLVIPLDLR